MQLATISAAVFSDTDADGIQQSGEMGIAGRTVFIDTNGDGLLSTGEPTGITDANAKCHASTACFRVHIV